VALKFLSSRRALAPFASSAPPCRARDLRPPTLSRLAIGDLIEDLRSG